MRAVDTNVLVRLLVRDDAKQAAKADAFVEPGAWVSHIVLVETMWVLDSVYARTPAQIATTVEMLLAHVSLVIEGTDTVLAALATFRARPALGFSDCLIHETARRAGHLPFGTFDRAMAKLPGAAKL